MPKPTVYLDTSIISAHWYDGSDVAMLARQLKTRDWWIAEREHFNSVSSAFTEAELRAGVFPRQAECVRMIRRLPYIRMTQAARLFIQELIGAKVVPSNKPADAAHLAVATVASTDYLLTWNYAHMANPVVQKSLERLCDSAGLRAPLMVSPESIPQVRLSQDIRRRKHS
jgi:hypothetical protein